MKTYKEFINESIKNDSNFTQEELELIKKYSNFTNEGSYLEFEHNEETDEYETISKWIDGNLPRYTICVYRQDDYSGEGFMTVEYSHKIESKKNQTLEDFLKE